MLAYLFACLTHSLSLLILRDDPTPGITFHLDVEDEEVQPRFLFLNQSQPDRILVHSLFFFSRPPRLPPQFPWLSHFFGENFAISQARRNNTVAVRTGRILVLPNPQTQCRR